MEQTPQQQKNEIVVYQPDGTLRLDVRLENETVWLTEEHTVNPGIKKGCNREVAPFKQRFSTRCNRMAVRDAVCVI